MDRNDSGYNFHGIADDLDRCYEIHDKILTSFDCNWLDIHSKRNMQEFLNIGLDYTKNSMNTSRLCYRCRRELSPAEIDMLNPDELSICRDCWANEVFRRDHKDSS